jgi:hypothetical protein
MPYLVVGLVAAAGGGALYGSGAIGVLGAYAVGLAAILVAAGGLRPLGRAPTPARRASSGRAQCIPALRPRLVSRGVLVARWSE